MFLWRKGTWQSFERNGKQQEAAWSIIKKGIEETLGSINFTKLASYIAQTY